MQMADPALTQKQALHSVLKDPVVLSCNGASAAELFDREHQFY